MYNGQVPILGWKSLNSVFVDEFHSNPEISHGDMWKRGTTWLDEHEYDIKVGLMFRWKYTNSSKQCSGKQSNGFSNQMYRKEVMIKINATKFKVIKSTKLKCFGFEVWKRKDD